MKKMFLASLLLCAFALNGPAGTPASTNEPATLFGVPPLARIFPEPGGLPPALAQLTNSPAANGQAPAGGTPNALFSAHELTLDLASTYTAAEPGGVGQLFSRNARHGLFGIGLGATYWGTKNLGAGVEVGVRDFNHLSSLVIDSTTITVSGRYPIGPVAPYVVAGVGRNFSDGLYNTQAGLGVEWRFSRRAGVFSDARFVWQYRQSSDVLLVRLGIRFVF